MAQEKMERKSVLTELVRSVKEGKAAPDTKKDVITAFAAVAAVHTITAEGARLGHTHNRLACEILEAYILGLMAGAGQESWVITTEIARVSAELADLAVDRAKGNSD